jgi:hypothetical protein
VCWVTELAGIYAPRTGTVRRCTSLACSTLNVCVHVQAVDVVRVGPIIEQDITRITHRDSVQVRSYVKACRRMCCAGGPS